MLRLAFRPMTVIGIMALLAVVVGAQAPQPTDYDKLTARIVVYLLEHDHMARPKIDDEISKKWARNFLKDLDPQKTYFEKTDIDEFLAKDATLDDNIRAGNLEFPIQVFERFKNRSEERYNTVLELLKQKPDFTVDESFIDDPDHVDYPADAKASRELWRKKIKFEWLLLKVSDDKLTDDDIVKKLTIRYRDRNRNFHQFDMSEELEFYLTSLTRTFDPHSNYMNARTWEDTIKQQLQLQLEGIGASLQSEDGYAVVKEIVPGAAADKDGRLQPEDKIVAIQNDDGSEIDLVEKKLGDVVRYIRGKAGSKVRLVVQPADTKERKIYELIRQKVELTQQHAKGQIIETKGEGDKTMKIGVIALPAFYGDTQGVLQGRADAVSATADCKRIIDGFKHSGVDCVMMDLRGNGGGLLNEAITLSGLFIDTGPVVQVRELGGVKQIDDDDDGTSWDGPLVVVIDHLSASASEIFAGVIKDYSRGLIIGDSSTFGKGTVQQILPINEAARARPGTPDLGALKLTIQQFYRANGESTQIRGVAPDIHIQSLADAMIPGEGKMDNALSYGKIPERPHIKYNRVPEELVTRLEARSSDRRKADPKFQKEEEKITKYKVRKERHSVSLNEVKFRAEFVPDDDLEKDRSEAKKQKDKRKNRFHEHVVWESDYYNDEVVRIVSDYLTLGGAKVIASVPVRAAAHN